MSAMRVLGVKGHTTTTWDTGSETDVPESEVRAEFEKLMAQNFVAFDTGVDQKGGEKIEAFRPTAENLLVFPALAGGC